MLQTQMLGYINNNLQRLNDNQTQLSTGRKINKPSDDPVGITYALRYRSDLSINDQYQSNVNNAQSKLDHTDTILGQLNDLTTSVTQLTVQGTTGTNPQTALNAIAEQLGTLYDQALTIGNDKFNGAYTFNGQLVDKQPYQTGTEATDNGQINMQFGAGITMATNVIGNQVFGNPTDADNLFTVIKGLKTALTNGDIATAKTYLPLLQSRSNTISDMRAEVGAKSNRLEMMSNRLKDISQNLTGMQSNVEDADIAQVITDLKANENVYQASLSAGAKIIQPSLIDFLK